MIKDIQLYRPTIIQLVLTYDESSSTIVKDSIKCLFFIESYYLILCNQSPLTEVVKTVEQAKPIRDSNNGKGLNHWLRDPIILSIPHKNTPLTESITRYSILRNLRYIKMLHVQRYKNTNV